MSDLLDFLDQEVSYVSKIKQNDVSIPISYAAVGNESYGDLYNTTQKAGYTISNTTMPGITSNVQNTPIFSSTKEYTKPQLEEITAELKNIS